MARNDLERLRRKRAHARRSLERRGPNKSKAEIVRMTNHGPENGARRGICQASTAIPQYRGAGIDRVPFVSPNREIKAFA